MYMSYCRFEGTKQELNACIYEVMEHINGEAEYEVSEDEIRCFRMMVYNMIDFLQGAELLNEDGELDAQKLEEVCEAMKHGTEEEDEE